MTPPGRTTCLARWLVRRARHPGATARIRRQCVGLVTLPVALGAFMTITCSIAVSCSVRPPARKSKCSYFALYQRPEVLTRQFTDEPPVSQLPSVPNNHLVCRISSPLTSGDRLLLCKMLKQRIVSCIRRSPTVNAGYKTQVGHTLRCSSRSNITFDITPSAGLPVDTATPYSQETRCHSKSRHRHCLRQLHWTWTMLAPRSGA
jgi:hypothetical protein